ncbi:RraA family protein [Aestuariibacter halophilus]|uniref:Putative 4-hydroxy-4-methyl-2-oxoglutarate aldolase n=1 Tax=Fluctibacter halophilus TaxID=226011 RepID=A0ABS8GD12_9ALTE|nr:RraA family protein [Aestuariibacter halophilus]MCC2618273.1 RraA family protein [Aestuariibacter halophilus]
MDYQRFGQISPCEYADALPRSQFMSPQIRELWPQIPRIAGPAFTVKCAPGDHLMLHAAIYRAKPGDVIVVQADPDFAVAGGNVCAIAQQRGIAGFVVDGVIRDLAETRDIRFPVFARGVIPKPGAKKQLSPLNQPILCGGVTVNPGDIVIADEEGIAVVPKDDAEEAYRIAKARTDKDTAMSLDQWREQHHAKVEEILHSLGFQDNE